MDVEVAVVFVFFVGVVGEFDGEFSLAGLGCRGQRVVLFVVRGEQRLFAC